MLVRSLYVLAAYALHIQSGLSQSLSPINYNKRYSNGSDTSILEVFQAETPPRKSLASPSCRQTILQYDFANSYDVPYVGSYSPPVNCNFTTTIFSISGTSKGHQYDRLALLFFGNIEIWRTSTPMPVEGGIHWTYQKDMTVFDTLLREKQKVIFDLGNVYSDEYTGTYNITIEALYYNDVYTSDFQPAEEIYPISTLSASQNVSSVMTLPDDNGTVSLQFPRNVEKAVVSILASGNSAEEFWYTNVPSEYVNTFPDNEGWLYGYSPFREVQLLIDGNLAGVSWPFPILFTGGVDPGLWRPIVGIDAYDLPTFEIDVTPFLSLLCDGASHTFQLKVVAYDTYAPDNIGTVGEDWYVTGTVFIWLDKQGNQTTGGNITTTTPTPSFTFNPLLTTSPNTTTNTSLYFNLTATRHLPITSLLHTSSGYKNATWSQSLSFLNIQNMTDDAYNQSLSMHTNGQFFSSNTPATAGVSVYSYPLNLYSSYIIAPTTSTLSSVFALIDRSLLSVGYALLPYFTGLSLGPTEVATRQNASSMYYWNETIVWEVAQNLSAQEGGTWYSYAGEPGNQKEGVTEYSRYIAEKNEEGLVVDEWAWGVMEVPETIALPFVYGEPAV